MEKIVCGSLCSDDLDCVEAEEPSLPETDECLTLCRACWVTDCGDTLGENWTYYATETCDHPDGYCDGQYQYDSTTWFTTPDCAGIPDSNPGPTTYCCIE